LSVNRLIFRNAQASELRNTELVLAGSAADTSLAAFSRLPLKAFEIEKNYPAGAIFFIRQIESVKRTFFRPFRDTFRFCHKRAFSKRLLGYD
jgi:hypothetical protein